MLRLEHGSAGEVSQGEAQLEGRAETPSVPLGTRAVLSTGDGEPLWRDLL